jgi:hypothetical protein
VEKSNSDKPTTYENPSIFFYSIQIPKTTDICVKRTGGNYQYRGCFCCSLFSPIASFSLSLSLSLSLPLSLTHTHSFFLIISSSSSITIPRRIPKRNHRNETTETKQPKRNHRNETTEVLKLKLQLFEKSLPLSGIEPGTSLSTRECAIH